MFINLHSHSIYSFADALITVKDTIKLAKDNNASAVCLTEHGNLVSMPILVKEAEKEGIKWITGCEFYFTFDAIKATERKSHHLVALAKNEQGWKNLLKLQKLSNTPASSGGGYFYRPRITEKMLYEHQEGLIILTACLQGPIASLILEDKKIDAAILAQTMKSKIEHFYLEIQPHETKEQELINKGLIDISKRLNIPLVTTLDLHLMDKSYQQAYIVNGDLRRNLTKSKTGDFSYDLSYKTEEEIFAIYDRQGIEYNDALESIKNTVIISDMCDFKWENRKFKQPEFCENADEELEKILGQNLINKFNGINNIPLEYKQRTRYEYDVIKQMGFSNYFLILNDALKYCDEKNVVRGVGRGSAAGSLLSWILNITKVDSLKAKLPFERFLNPERLNTVPDVDTDLGSQGKKQLIEYLKDKYGESRVVQVATFSEMKPKVALKDAGRWLEIPFQVMNDISASIPAKAFDEDGNAIEMDFDEMIKLPQIQEYIKKYPELFDIASKLNGSIRQVGVHAGACCILPENAENIIPLMKKKDEKGADVFCSQWDKKLLEDIGIHKYDFLGLSTLETLNECETLSGVKACDIPLDDKKTWEYLQKAKNMLGLFQLTEDKTKKYLRDIKPTEIAHLSDVNTLIRPGTNSEEYFKNLKSKKLEYEFDLPEIREELDQTNGAIIYQENVMMLAHSLANFTLGEGDLLRRALEKNKKEEVEKWKKKFIEDCKYKETAEQLFDWIAANAGYAFNKAHAYSYSLIGYYTAYYKANFPEVFLISNLNHPKSTAKQTETEYIADFIVEARNMGINIELPKLGDCYPKNFYDGKVIHYGLSNIKGISASTALLLCSIDAVDFDDFTDKSMAIKRTYTLRGKDSERQLINKAHIKNLCKIGFFGDIFESIKKYSIKYKEKRTEELEQDFEDLVNDALGFEYYSILDKYYERIDEKYRNEDLYKIIRVENTKKGETRGRQWTMIKGSTRNGKVTAFISEHPLVSKNDIILANYKQGKGDSISLNWIKLVDG